MIKHLRQLLISFVSVSIILLLSCQKDKEPVKEPVFIPKTILYSVKGTNLKLNYIDSQSAFQRDKIYQDSFHYEFKKGPGAYIGVTINKQSDNDSIFSWQIIIDGKLFANAFSEGGAYFTIPYD